VNFYIDAHQYPRSKICYLSLYLNRLVSYDKQTIFVSLYRKELEKTHLDLIGSSRVFNLFPRFPHSTRKDIGGCPLTYAIKYAKCQQHKILISGYLHNLMKRLLLHLVHDALNTGRSRWKCATYTMLSSTSSRLRCLDFTFNKDEKADSYNHEVVKGNIFLRQFLLICGYTRTLVTGIQWLKRFQISHDSLNHFWGQVVHLASCSSSSTCSIETGNGFLTLDKSFRWSSGKQDLNSLWRVLRRSATSFLNLIIQLTQKCETLIMSELLCSTLRSSCTASQQMHFYKVH